MTLIVDAAPIVALGDDRDPRHQAIRRVLQDEPGPLVIPAPVSAEIDYLVRRRGGAGPARAFLRDVSRGTFRVEGLTAEDHALAAALDERYSDLALGLADLSVLILAERFSTRRVLTFDHREFRAVTPLSGGNFTLLPHDESG